MYTHTHLCKRERPLAQNVHISIREDVFLHTHSQQAQLVKRKSDRSRICLFNLAGGVGWVGVTGKDTRLNSKHASEGLKTHITSEKCVT